MFRASAVWFFFLQKAIICKTAIISNSKKGFRFSLSEYKAQFSKTSHFFFRCADLQRLLSRRRRWRPNLKWRQLRQLPPIPGRHCACHEPCQSSQLAIVLLVTAATVNCCDSFCANDNSFYCFFFQKKMGTKS